MPYIGRSTDGFGVRNRFLYLASASDTSVSGADVNGATLTFTDGAYVDVYLNGVLLKAGTDYNTNTAGTIAGLAAMAANDEVTVVVYDVFTVGDMVSATSGGTFTGNVTHSGTVTFGSTVSGLDVNGTEIILDADADTSITADTDDQIDIKIAGADDFQFTANTFTSLSGSTIATNTISETTSGSGVTIDSVLLKDGGIDVNGNEIILDADADTSITADTDDQIDFRIGGSDKMSLTASALNVTGNIEPTGSVRVDDGQYFQAGDSYDLQMYHDGSNSFIEDQGTGDLILKGTVVRVRSDNLVISNAANNEDMITAAADGAVNLRHNNVSCLTTTSDGGIDIEGGDIFFSTSGKGINLGVTSNTDSNTLDDYEEGTFNMTFNVASGSITVSSSHDTLVYTKIGRNVYVSGRIRVNAVSSPSGSTYLQGLPFTPAVTPEDSSPTMIFVGHDGMSGLSSGGQPMVGQVYHNEARIFLYTQDQNGIANSGDHFTASSIVGFNFFYVAT